MMSEDLKWIYISYCREIALNCSDKSNTIPNIPDLLIIFTENSLISTGYDLSPKYSFQVI